MTATCFICGRIARYADGGSGEPVCGFHRLAFRERHRDIQLARSQREARLPQERHERRLAWLHTRSARGFHPIWARRSNKRRSSALAEVGEAMSRDAIIKLRWECWRDGRVHRSGAWHDPLGCLRHHLPSRLEAECERHGGDAEAERQATLPPTTSQDRKTGRETREDPRKASTEGV